MDEAIEAAAAALKARIEDCYEIRPLTLRLLYSDGWLVRGDAALVDALMGK